MTPDRWRQIEDLYHAAQKRHPNERTALLECTDPEIRSRVERMLAVESGGQILDQSPDGLLAGPTRSVVAVVTLVVVAIPALTVTTTARAAWAQCTAPSIRDWAARLP